MYIEIANIWNLPKDYNIPIVVEVKSSENPAPTIVKFI